MSREQKQEQQNNTSKKKYPMPRNWYGDSDTQYVRRVVDKKGGIDGKKLG